MGSLIQLITPWEEEVAVSDARHRFRFYRFDVVGAWRHLFRVNPRMTAKTRFVSRGFIEMRGGGERVCYGYTYFDGRLVVLLDPEPTFGTAVLTAMHEWVHEVLGTRAHNNRFRRKLRRFCTQAGYVIPMQKGAPKLSLSDYEHAVISQIDASRAAAAHHTTIVWKRGIPCTRQRHP